MFCNLPKKWFFCDPFSKKSLMTVSLLDYNVGVILYNKKSIKEILFSNEISKVINLLKNKRICFLIHNSIILARKFSANGVFLSIDQLVIKRSLNLKIKDHAKKFLFATTVHNQKEIRISRSKKFDFIFISPVYKTQTHRSVRPINPLGFLNLSKKSNSRIFALGGINDQNFKRLKNKFLYGFGAINYFINQLND